MDLAQGQVEVRKVSSSATQLWSFTSAVSSTTRGCWRPRSREGNCSAKATCPEGRRDHHGDCVESILGLVPEGPEDTTE
jgi:hypothetical protein